MRRAASVSTGSTPPRGGALAVALVLAAVLGLAALSIDWWPQGDLASARSAPPLFVAFVLLVFGGCCVALGALWASLRSREALHELRQREDVFTRVGGAWLWQTDHEHRLIAMRPPADASNAAWAHHPPGRPALWQHFGGVAASEDGLALAARLKERVALDRVSLRAPVGEPGEPGGRARWTLSGAPHLDADGRFLGYYGLAWPMAEADLLLADRAALRALLTELPWPLMEITQDAEGRWLLLRANAAAARLAGLGDAAVAGPQPWPGFAAHWPPALSEAVARLDPGRRITAAGWTARWIEPQALPEPAAPRRLLLLEPADGPREETAEADAFIYSVSHDLRAPIRVIEGFARILKEDYSRLLDRIGNDHLDRVLGAAQRTHQMIDALLELSRLAAQPIARQRVDLSQLAHFVLDDLSREAPSRRCEFDVEAGIVAEGDPALLRVVLENLLGNAWKYSGRNVVTRIAFRRAEPRGRPAVMVADNGAGFDMRFADRLFGVFQRLHSAADFAGSGVGLASVRRILARHGSEIWAESEVGQGARFYFTLP